MLSRHATACSLCSLWLIVCTFSVAPSSQGDILEHFKYGALGTEERAGVPYWIWRVLPVVFADKLPDRPGNGWEKLGLLYESSGRDRPIGTTNAGGSVKLIGLNCATCHAGSNRETPAAARRIVLGMPANQLDLQGYLRFLTASAQDLRFTASNLIAAIEKVNPRVGFFEKLVYRLIVIGRTRRGIIDRAQETAWFDSRPPKARAGWTCSIPTK